MTEGLRPEHEPAFRQVVEEDRVGLLEPPAPHDRHCVAEVAPPVERVEDADLLPVPDPLVVRSEARCDVHEPRTLFGRDEVVQHDAVPAGSGSRGVEGRPVTGGR